jgi:uroporphyrinogen decarboxylase
MMPFRPERTLHNNKPLVEKLLAFTTELSVAYFTFMLEIEGIDGIFIPDPSASGDVVSARHFEKAVVPCLTNVVKRLLQYQKCRFRSVISGQCLKLLKVEVLRTSL